MTWTRERPKGVDAMRDYQNKRYPTGARSREYYPADDPIQSRDGRNDYTDSWWHPVRADGRYPALPVEDGRKWVPTKGHTLTGRGWNAYWDMGEVPSIDPWDTIEDATSCFAFDYVLPYRDGDTRDTLPPLPSGETPAPLTPAEEATLREKPILPPTIPNEMPRWVVPAPTPTAPEPSRLEIADWQLRAIVSAIVVNTRAVLGGQGFGGTAPPAFDVADEIIAAARKGGGA